MAEEMDRITVTEDVGVYEPAYKRVQLILMDDGSVRWEAVDDEG